MVRISADEIAGTYQVANLNIIVDDHDLPFGMIVEKVTTTRCIVQESGEVRGVYSGLTPGKQLFVDLSSRLTQVVPSRPATGIKWIHPVAQALSSEVVLLRVQVPVKIHA
jgi:hypothetical protein